MTRTELEALIASYMHRSDLTGDIPGFISLATQRLGRMLRSQVNQTIAILQPVTATSDLPANYRGMRALYAQESRGPVALSSVSTHRITRFANTGSPAAYSITGKKLTIAPFRAGDFELHYYNEPAELVSGTSENAVLDEYPYLYLYASLVEANIFLQNPDQAARMLSIFTGEVHDVNSQSMYASAGDAPAVIGV